MKKIVFIIMMICIFILLTSCSGVKEEIIIDTFETTEQADSDKVRILGVN